MTDNVDSTPAPDSLPTQETLRLSATGFATDHRSNQDSLDAEPTAVET